MRPDRQAPDNFAWSRALTYEYTMTEFDPQQPRRQQFFRRAGCSSRTFLGPRSTVQCQHPAQRGQAASRSLRSGRSEIQRFGPPLADKLVPSILYQRQWPTRLIIRPSVCLLCNNPNTGKRLAWHTKPHRASLRGRRSGIATNRFRASPRHPEYQAGLPDSVLHPVAYVPNRTSKTRCAE
jgi:hypothetical protein